MSRNSSISNFENPARRPGADYRRFLIATGLGFVLTLGLGLVWNWLVDPYGMFGTPRIGGFNELKPTAGTRIRYAKPYYADRIRAHTVIAGNSRPETGLNPQSACWPAAQEPVFNAAVPGAGLALQIAFAEHAMVTAEVTQVYLALDFLDFLVDPEAPATAPAAHLFPNVNLRVGTRGIDNPGYARRRAAEWTQAMGSLATLSDAMQTVLRQGEQYVTTRNTDGFNPGRHYVTIIRREGQAVLFRRKNSELVRRLGPRDDAMFQAGEPWSSVFDTLDRFLDRVRSQKVDVTLFINPYHVDYLTVIRETARWSQLDDWKAILAGIARRQRIPLWDFNAINRYTTEAPPDRGDRRRTVQAFWEPAHYRPEYGELMLSAMLGSNCASSLARTKPVGVRLDQVALAPYLRTLRSALDAHLARDTAALARVRCLIDRASMPGTCSSLGL